ncbi:hypothetical protein TrLO_g1322 [Triparma laevis f. longispina]|uniref:Uncharacterized protein n=1 Tax=Triparma laevis f. longispina TaxID=1714387 RepID=A0A9W7FQP4_9STRA|nr:hypothetical protein TrLO_g1322 [Triparma laevis f. longispina]
MSKVQFYFSKAHLFDFVTCWSHWFLFVVVFWPSVFGFDLPSSIIVGARLSVMSTSIFGTLILLARGYDCLPYIKKELYLHDPNLVLPFFDSLPVILGIDALWHGLPFWLVLVSKPIDSSDVNTVNTILTVGGLGASFLLFEKIRRIVPSDTYGLRGIKGNTPFVLTGIALTSCNFYAAALNGESACSGWSGLIESTGLIEDPVLLQRLSAFLVMGGWYFMVLMFGRLPGSGEEDTKNLFQLIRELNVKLKEMHLKGDLGNLLRVQVPKLLEEKKTKMINRVTKKTPTRSRSRARRRSKV